MYEGRARPQAEPGVGRVGGGEMMVRVLVGGPKLSRIINIICIVFNRCFLYT